MIVLTKTTFESAHSSDQQLVLLALLFFDLLTFISFIVSVVGLFSTQSTASSFDSMTIVYDFGLKDSDYSFSKMIGRTTKELIVVGQNNFTVINNPSFEKDLLDALKRINVTIAFTTPRAMNEIEPSLGAQHMLDILKKLKVICEQNILGESLRILFEPGASSLSFFLSDKDEVGGLLVFTAKISTDMAPMRRSYFVVSAERHKELFNTIVSPLTYMTDRKDTKSKIEIIDEKIEELKKILGVSG